MPVIINLPGIIRVFILGKKKKKKKNLPENIALQLL